MLKKIEPVDYSQWWNKYQYEPIHEAMAELSRLLTDKVNEMVDEFNKAGDVPSDNSH